MMPENYFSILRGNHIRISAKAEIAYYKNFLVIKKNEKIFKINCQYLAPSFVSQKLCKGFSCDAMLSEISPEQINEFEKIVKFLEKEQLIRHSDGTLKRHYSQDFLSHFDRLIGFLEKLENSEEAMYNKMELLRKSKVMLVGVGSLGSWIAQHLIANGIGNIILVDFDTVSTSNLSRQSTFLKEDVGKYKIDVTEDRLKNISPYTHFEKERVKITSFMDAENLLSKFPSADLIIQTADEPIWQIGLWLYEAAVIKSKPIIRGNRIGAGPFYYNKNTACLGCEYAKLLEKDMAELIQSRRDLSFVPSPVTSIDPALVSTLIVRDIIFFLLDKKELLQTVNKRIKIDLFGDLEKKIDFIPSHIHCKICGKHNV